MYDGIHGLYHSIGDESVKEISKSRSAEAVDGNSGIGGRADAAPEQKLSGMKNIWRIRVFDNYRISYEVDRGELRVLVIEIATRGSAYRK